jgi:hypothetical protein
MSPNANTSGNSYLPQKTQQTVDAFNQLNTDAKLALLYFIYKKMGGSITPAAPQATDPGLAPKLMGDFFEMSKADQLAIMRQIVNRDDTEMSHAYGALKENNQLMVWYAWAQGMGKSVVDMPGNYQATDAANDLLGQIENLDFQEQISMLREIASGMGYSTVKPTLTQAETGKTSSL